jgi:hypothetical protein
MMMDVYQKSCSRAESAKKGFRQHTRNGWVGSRREKERKEGRKRRGESAKKGQTARKGNHPYIISMPAASFKLATPDKRNPTDLHIQFGRIFMSTFSSIRCPFW